MIMIMAMFVTITAFAQVNPAKFTDNISVEIKGGVSTPMSFEGVSPIYGIQVDKYVTPWLGFGIDANIIDFYGSKDHTLVDGVNVNLLGKVNLFNTFNYEGKRYFEPVIFAGIGWGHVTCSDINPRNMQVTKTGAELNFNFDKAWSVRVSPAVVWTSNKLSKNNGNLELTVGLVYHFKNHDGNRVFTKARLYDEREIRLLNNVIDNLRKDNLYLRNILKNKPKTIEIHKTDTVFIYPHLQFKQNSHYLESESALYQMAEYMKKSDKKFVISGYASKEGPEKFNQELSQKRAEFVANLLKELGVTNVEAVGKGATDKFSSENKLNRIVTIE
jgi:outer membrane protein OmpA-like peptidoglycan-associated protein